MVVGDLTETKVAMSDINVTFCRTLLKTVMADIKKITSPAERKAAWVYRFSLDGSWEFHGPDRFYWYGRADNAYDARAQGWQAWEREIELKGQLDRMKQQGKKERESKASAHAA